MQPCRDGVVPADLASSRPDAPCLTDLSHPRNWQIRPGESSGKLIAVEILADLIDPFLDFSAIRLELGFARTAEKAEAAALPFEVGPGPDQTRALIFQTCEFDLHAPLAGARAPPKDFQNYAGTVDDLSFPAALQIALLDWGQSGVHKDDAGIFAGHDGADFLDLAFAEKEAWTHCPQGLAARLKHFKVERLRQTAGFFKP